MKGPGVVEVDLGALARNYGKLAQAARPGLAGAVVKANGYGLGVARVASRLREAGCRHFFVATPAEGLELRSILTDAEIFVFSGPCATPPDELRAARLVPVLNSLQDFARWGDAGPAAVHIDTGMNRLGLSRADVAALRLETGLLARVDVRWVMTHLACADEPAHALNRQQIATFDELRALWPDARTSVANSAASWLGPGYQCDLTRPGIALYGANPYRRDENPVEPVISLRGRILQLREVGAGESIGYGATFVADKSMRVAVVGVGYADGYLRSLGNCGIAEVAGVRVPVVGRVSMDLVCFDVSAVPAADVDTGDWVTLIGASVTLEELAALAGTINYELLTALGNRLERVYRDTSREEQGS